MSRNIENTYQYENVYNDFGRQNVTDKQKNKQDEHMVNRPMQFNDECQNNNKQTTAKR